MTRFLLPLAALIVLAGCSGNAPEIKVEQTSEKKIARQTFESLPKEVQDQMKAEGYEVVEQVEMPQGIPGASGPTSR
ncbi:MAG: hypothetical protein MH204_11770 [Fimbriimonadaceae bacterium]|nr:hypothetical protein [Fimbriimonadaceae bacterium]